MNKEKLSAIFADPSAVERLQACKSLDDFVACLNKSGADCTAQEGVKLLQAWLRSAEGVKNEAMDMEEMEGVAGGTGEDFEWLMPVIELEDDAPCRFGPPPHELIEGICSDVSLRPLPRKPALDVGQVPMALDFQWAEAKHN